MYLDNPSPTNPARSYRDQGLIMVLEIEYTNFRHWTGLTDVRARQGAALLLLLRPQLLLVPARSSRL